MTEIKMIDYPVATLPDHITKSGHFKEWREMFPDETVFPFLNNQFVETLEIHCQADFDRIIDADYLFRFTRSTRIEILKRMYTYWSEDPNSAPMTLPIKDKSWFSGQVLTLFSERETTIAMACFKRNYVELFDYLLERDGLEPHDYGMYNVFSLPYYGVMNNHIEIVRRGLEVGCKTSMDLFDVAIDKKNLEMFNLLVEFEVYYTPKTVIIAAKIGLPEMYEYFLRKSENKPIFPQFVLATLYNLDNLKYLLLTSGIVSDYISVNGANGVKLLKECLLTVRSLETIQFLEKHYDTSIQQIRIEAGGYLYIDDAIIKKGDYELYMYLRNNGFETSPHSAAIALENKCNSISPGLLKKHATEDLRRKKMREYDAAFRRERDEEDERDRAEEEAMN